MSRLVGMVADDGMFLTLQRLPVLLFRRLRNCAVGGRLGSANFYCGHAPRLLGVRHMRVGRNFHAGDHVWLHAIQTSSAAPLLRIGDDVTFSENVHVGCVSRVEIGSGCLFGSRVLVIDHAHGAYRGDAQSDPAVPPSLRPLVSNGAIVIGQNVWLGDDVAVLPGAVIGDGAVIGTHSVVTGTIAAGTMALGAPARPVRRWDSAARQWLPISREDRD